MEKKIFRKKLLILLMIISIVATDFFILGSNLLTYSSDISDETNNPNVEFSAYFKNDAKERVDSIEKSIRDDNLKLYAEIIVKNEGYLNEGTTIEIEDSNFNLKNAVLSPYIKEINGNKVVLKQITAGEAIEIELDIEPITSEKINTNMLSKISIVKLNGSYTGTTETGIQYGKEVCIDFQVDGEATADLETDIITNKVLSINGTNKRVVQLLIKSRLTENQYPIQQTKLNVTVPVLGEETPEINVMAIGTLATNGAKELVENSWTTSNGNVEITIKNEADTNNEIQWNKNVYDELVVTYLYSESTDTSNLEITTNSEIKVYNSENTYTAQYTKGIGNLEPNNVIVGKTEITTQEMYKGQIYANINAPYNTKTTVVVTNPDVADKIIVKEGPDAFGKEESELNANTRYVSTKINLAEMLALLGQNGTIQIINGGTTTTINKDTAVDENGNIFIYYENSATEIEITTSKPEKEGILEIEHIKAIAENSYSRTQLKEIKTLNVRSQTSATLEGTKVVENTTAQAVLELKETMTKAELTIENNKNTLSATEENEVTLGITLITDGTQYDLFKNPEISLQFPESVEIVELKDSLKKQNSDEFTINVGDYNSSERTIKISFTGEQVVYPESSLTQSYIQLKLNVILSKFATDQTGKITMTYTNENATQYHGGTTGFGAVEKEVQISGQPGLMREFNSNLNENTLLTEKNAGQTISFETLLLNNTGSNINNIRIVGKLPTTGNKIQEQIENTLETTLKNISAENATIYYTENVNATSDVEDSTNGWTTDLTTLTNAKLYLIKLETLNQGSIYTATVNVQLPEILEAGVSSYTEYKVVYDTEYANNIEETSRNIQLATAPVSDLQVDLTAQVGGQELTNGTTVKEGEVIRYTVTVTNNTKDTIENIALSAGVPEGTTVVKEIDYYPYLLDSYYEEKTDIKEMPLTISKLASGETYQASYEVRVNTDITEGTQISNKVKATYNNKETESQELINQIQESKIRMTIKKAIDKEIKLTSGSEVKYDVIVENLSNETVNNLVLEIVSDDFTPETQKITLGEIPANSNLTQKIKGTIKIDADKMQISVLAIDSNNTYRSNMVTESLVQADATITLTSSQNNAILREGDIVEYNILVQNTGNVAEEFKIYDVIPEELEVQSVSSSINSNLIYEGINIEPGKKESIDITAKVKAVSNTKVITNQAKVEVLNVYKGVSQEITHTILPTEITEDTKNIISGSVWFDANVNGRKDKGEPTLEGVTVKLYDKSANNYLTDQDGKVITQKPNTEGEYIFTKIPNGIYMIVFEYDTQKYEPTIYYANGVDTTVSSKATLKNITVNNEIITVTAIDMIDVQDNISYMNIGLKDRSAKPSVEYTKKTITGHAWFDANKNGQKDDEEKAIPAIKVKVYDVSTNNYLKDINGRIVETTTNSKGEYYLTNIEKGLYKIIFEYDTEKYNLTTYLADGVDETKNSKVIINKVKINGNEVEVASTDLIKLEDDLTNINIGLKEKTSQDEDGKTISGSAWFDANKNGKMDSYEVGLSGIKVKLYNVSTNNYLKDKNGNVIEALTDDSGKYIFNNIEQGSYILVFEYDTYEYEPTTYLADGVDTTVNSKVMLKKININGQEITAAVTDTINLQSNILNINIGLKEKLIFDLELNKYISRIVVQTSKETKAYDYENDTFEKVEIHRKQMQGALVVLEYTIKIKNNGEIAGYAKNIIDYVPNGLVFSSELNKDWYLSENYLYTKSLENTEIKPGEEKEIKLILTKTMTADNIGLINNRAEIFKDYNQYGESDIDSIPNNQIQGEDDYGIADVSIQVATGGSITAYVILAIINLVLIGIAIKLMIKNNVIKVTTKEERR